MPRSIREPIPVRFHKTQKQATESGEFYPHLGSMPAIPVIDWSVIDAEPPKPLDSPDNSLPSADVVVITWAEAEWASMEHVFLLSDTPLQYYRRDTSSWPGWQKYSRDMPYYRGGDWTYWGEYHLAEVGRKKVLLFKSQTHLDWPGQPYLEDLIRRIAQDVKPDLLLSIGTAGGARPTDHVGAVNTVHSGTLCDASKPPSHWPTYSNSYTPDWSTIKQSGFSKLLFPVPATKERLELLAKEFNVFYGTSYSLSDLDPDGLNEATSEPALNNLVPDGVPLLTTQTFVVGTNNGQYKDFACIEMDDAVIAKVCKMEGVKFGFVRNISDPVQNAQLPSSVQGNWGSAVYDAFGMYTSYNGALVAWALIEAG